ncbi:MAG: NUDIX domain-containing protein [Anaerolineales bacterium]|nr:NUDIX domain-containing protein [Anaerolineales bacterium]
MDTSSFEFDLAPNEFAELSWRYGEPEVRTVSIEADEYLFVSRSHRASHRRGEVVMVIEPTDGYVLLHRKGWYERGVYRLPTGGIDVDESVEDALFRELDEETGLEDGDIRFLGIIDSLIYFQSEAIHFTSYIFHIQNPQGSLSIQHTNEDISDFYEVTIEELSDVAENLRNVPPPRTGWGHWRAITHEFVYEALS